jgi:hypothetical protein
MDLVDDQDLSDTHKEGDSREASSLPGIFADDLDASVQQ